MKVRFYSLLIFLFGAWVVNAQDIHFSQFYLSPLTLNPALTGNFNGLYRITGIYRDQWPGLAGGKAVFVTPSIGVDFSLLRNKIKHGALGVGVVFVNDEQNGGLFNTNTILASVAYNMLLGPKFQWGVGLQGGIISEKINFNQFTFNDGYYVDPTGSLSYNASLVDETFGKTKPKGQFNAGIFLKYSITDKIRVYAGYALQNLTQYKAITVTTPPASGSNSASAFNTPIGNVLHGGFEFDIKDQGILIPGILYQNQAKADETNFGLTYGIHVIRDPEKRFTIYFGLWNRINTGNYTLIPKVGFEWKGFRAGFAYDAPLTDQLSDHNTIGGPYAQAFELALSYVGRLIPHHENNYLFNPFY